MIDPSLAAAEESALSDGELLSLAGEFHAAWAIEKQVELDDEVAFVAARERTALVVQAIATLPATTLAGLRVKAVVALWFQADDHVPKSVDALEWPLHNDIIEGLLGLT
jgi:hypothetical protein